MNIDSRIELWPIDRPTPKVNNRRTHSVRLNPSLVGAPTMP